MEAITAAHGGGYLLGAGNRLTKFDPDGSTEGERDYEVELVEAIATTDDGYVLAAQDGTGRNGTFFGGIRIGDAGSHGWIDRVDTDVPLSWTETYGTERYDDIRTLLSDEGGLAFGGLTTVDRTGRGWVVRLTADDCG